MIEPFIYFSLISAICWGIADFNGGMSTKQVNVLIVLITSQILGISMLGVMALTEAATPPSVDFIVVLSGVVCCIGLLFLYIGLASGKMMIIAPISGLMTAAIPVVFSFFYDGIPEIYQMLGILLALCSIVLFTYNFNSESRIELDTKSVLIGLIAGTNLGIFFITLSMFDRVTAYYSLIYLRIVSIAVAVIILMVIVLYSFISNRRDFNLAQNYKINSYKTLGFITLLGTFDAIANIYFVFAVQYQSLAIVSVISSLYPGSTVFLAWLILKEKLNKTQFLGILSAVSAVVLFSL
jgi:uncharacterized membrane protein